jgi:hypothetical protein
MLVLGKRFRPILLHASPPDLHPSRLHKRVVNEDGYPVQQSRTFDLGTKKVAQDQHMLIGVSPLPTQETP